MGVCKLFSIEGQLSFFLYFKKILLAMQALLQLHNSGVIGQKEPWTQGRCVGVTVFPSHFIYKNKWWAKLAYRL